MKCNVLPFYWEIMFCDHFFFVFKLIILVVWSEQTAIFSMYKFAHRFPALADDSTRGGRRDFDVRLKLHFLLSSEKVLLLKFSEYTTLSLQSEGGKNDLRVVASTRDSTWPNNWGSESYRGFEKERTAVWSSVKPLRCKVPRCSSLRCVKTTAHLKLGFRRAGDDDHPLQSIGAVWWSDLQLHNIELRFWFKTYTVLSMLLMETLFTSILLLQSKVAMFHEKT